MTVVYCIGTATDIGKTWVGAAVLTSLRSRGRTVEAVKPVQSFSPDDPHPTDAVVLATATGQTPDDVCPPERCFELAMAPPMAADALGRACPSIADMAALTVPHDIDLLWIEGVGGPRSPMAADGDGVDLAHALGPDITVLVADAGLGTINAVRSSLDALGHRRVVVMLNRFDHADDLHRRNRAWLTDRCGLTVAVAASELADLVVADGHA